MSKFEFSENDRDVLVHLFDVDGAYLGQNEIHVPKHQGLPARAVFGDIDTENNPVWNSDFRRVEYSDTYGARWFINSDYQSIAIDTDRIKPEPPEKKEGFVTQYIEGKYVLIPDYRGETFYRKEDGEPEVIENIGEIPGYLTPLPKPGQFYYFEGKEWVFDKSAETDYLILSKRQKRKQILDIVLAEINRYSIDKLAPEEYQSKENKRITDERFQELLQLRKELQDYPEQDSFPRCDLPEVPEWLAK